MATKEEIKQELNDAKARLDEATKKLEKWEEGKYKGEKLNDLEEKLSNEVWKNDGQKKEWEGWRDRLLKEKEELEAEKKRWGDQVEYLQKKLVEFGEGEGNEQIA